MNNCTALFDMNMGHNEQNDRTNYKMLYDDIWISIFVFGNVKDFLSINKTCYYFNKLTKNKAHITNIRINDYWYDQCKLLCARFKKPTNEVTKYIKTNKFNCCLVYQEVLMIISNSIAIKYKNELNDAITKHLNDDCDDRDSYYEWKRGFKCQLRNNLFRIQPKCYFEYLTTAPHSSHTENEDEDKEKAKENAKTEEERIEEKEKEKQLNWLDYKNNNHVDFDSPFIYNDFKQLFSDSDICILPFELLSCGIVDGKQQRAEPVALICDIIKHDCVNMFELFTRMTKLKNGYVHGWIGKLWYLQKSIYGDLKFTLLGASCYHGSTKILNYLLSIIPNIAYCNQNSEKYGKTPLMVAAEAHQVEIVKLLIPIVKQLGNDEISKVSTGTYDRETALHHAIMGDNLPANEQVKASEIGLLLIENGIDVNIGVNTYSALHYACSDLYFDIIKKLIQHPRIACNIDTCYWEPFPEEAEDEDDTKMEQELVLYSLIDCVCTQYNDSNESIMSQFKQLINFIIDYGIKTNNKNLENILKQTKDKNNITPLRYALGYLEELDVCAAKYNIYVDRRLEVLEFFLSKGCKCKDLDIIDWQTDTIIVTILHSIVELGNRTAMNRLLKLGFQDIYVKCEYNKTALEILAKNASKTTFNIKECDCTEITNHTRTELDMFSDFCWYILTHCDQFGGEIKVLKHLIIDTIAAKLILKFQIDPANPIQKQFIQIAQRLYTLVSRLGQ